MSKKSTNLAVISNNTFEAAKVVNLNHYDISSALQTTLDFNKLIAIFSSKIEALVPHSAYVYSNTEFGLEIKSGVFTRHSCSYALKVEEQKLGTLKLMRNHKFPEAELKLFVTASAEIRAQRRFDELTAKGEPVSYAEILQNVQERDRIDSTREASPLRKADDALVLDNSHMTREEQLVWVIEQVERSLKFS